jgi:Terminase RNaseH-like domain
MPTKIRPTEPRQALYTLWPQQQRAMQLLGLGPDFANVHQPVEELLFGGQAGGGKSLLLRAIGVTLCTIWPRAVVPLFRRTYPELEETQIRAILSEIPRTIARYTGDRHELRFPNGSVLEFRYCERENDVYIYQSAEWDALLIDEATHFTQHQVQLLRSRVRSTRPGWRPVIVYGSNPGNLGHGYFKDAFVDAAQPGRVFNAPKDDGGLRRCFLRARLDDNPSLNPDYRRMLEGIADPTMRRALLEGDWDVWAGQVFIEFRREVHTCEPFDIPSEWPRWCGLDYGFNAPMCCLWFSRSPDGKMYCYRELYQRELRDEDQARRVRDLSAGERIEFVAADPSMWSRQPNGTTIAAVYQQCGVAIYPANNDRLAGWQRVHDALAHGADRVPKLQIFSTCTNLIRTLPALTYDPHRVEDVDTRGDDHCADAARYALMGAAVKQVPIMRIQWGR